MQEELNNIYGYVIKYSMKIIFALVIFIVGKWAASITASIIDKSLSKTKINRTMVTFTKNIVNYGILIFAFNKLLMRHNVR